MTKHADIIRPFLFSVRLFLWISALITLSLTAWVVDHLKGYRAIFTLVIAVLTTAFYIPSLFTACMHRNRGYMLPLDIVFYALWLSAFIFVAQTDDYFDDVGFWTLCGLCLETLNIYFDSRHSTYVPTVNHPEKPNASGRGANDGTATTPSAEPAPAMNGEHTQV
ncbi:uncharacterized protein N7482_005879 [Penicillium canariense]|uniref:MARVEL domain-containing protein n=1 Tax=Penicillium canariense TaxID=189055 RepID=A0A9W9I5E6_9EURO|nr:uncharacterized protein N7482_005879 [Penicillium canariense]KAJ5167098.1 hypothetical protein N7482_005879 [Penicillium canariense]